MTLRAKPAKQYVKVMETAEVASPGGFSVPVTQQLGYIRLLMYKHGAHVGAEKFRLKVYHDLARTKLYATSSWSSISSISGVSTYWDGWVRFTFAEQWVNASEWYYLEVESTGYTRNQNTFYIGFVLDWPISIYTQTQAPGYSFAMEIYGYRKVAY